MKKNICIIAFVFIGFYFLISPLHADMRKDASLSKNEIHIQSGYELSREKADRPTTPALISPIYNAVVSGASVNLEWTASADATQYWLWVRRADDHTVVFTQSVGNTTSYNLTELANDGSAYAWMVRAGNTTSWSTWSAYRRFTTKQQPPVGKCGAYVAPGVWKELDCYNLAAIGKTLGDDPFTPSWRLIGGYWQWGRKGLDPSRWHKTNHPNFVHGPTGPGADEANSGAVSEWRQMFASEGAWSDTEKTAGDPCPAGYRVPTRAQWDGIIDNNPGHIVGTWSTTTSDDHINYGSARFFGNRLMLPAAGWRSNLDGSLYYRGKDGYYWSGTGDTGGYASKVHFNKNAGGTSLSYRSMGYSIRCIADEQQPVVDNSKFFGTFSGNTAYGSCVSKDQTVTIGDDSKSRFKQSYIYLPKSDPAGQLTWYTTTDGYPDLPVKVLYQYSVTDNQVRIDRTYSYGDSSIEEITETFTFDATLREITLSGTSSMNQCPGSITGTLTRIDSSDTGDCGAYIAPSIWKKFDCYNLAAIAKTTGDDPFTPSWRLIGGYWQWGRKGAPSYNWYSVNTADFAHGPTGPDLKSANSGYLNPWNTMTAPNGSWSDMSKTANDPCPDGYRVPTRAQWDGVINNNAQSLVGTLSTTWNDHTNYSSALFFGSSLMLPAAGIRVPDRRDSLLSYRGRGGSYWSSTGYANYSAGLMIFGRDYLNSGNHDRMYGASVRCIEDEQETPITDNSKLYGMFSGDITRGTCDPAYLSLTFGNDDGRKFEEFYFYLPKTDSVIQFSGQTTKKGRYAAVICEHTISENTIQIDQTYTYTDNSTERCLWTIVFNLDSSVVTLSGTSTDKTCLGSTEGILTKDAVGDVSRCGAFVAPGVWKNFDCYNLAAIAKTTEDDPFTPSWRMIGGYWQWGRKGPEKSIWYNTNTPNFAHGPTGTLPTEANSDAVSGWSRVPATQNAWYGAAKSANDPCPEGFRVPTIGHWVGVSSNNPQRIVGTWSTLQNDYTNYGSVRFFGDSLMLPAAGYRKAAGGALVDRGRYGGYWSSSGDRYYGYPLSFNSEKTSLLGSSYTPLNRGLSVRCISE